MSIKVEDNSGGLKRNHEELETGTKNVSTNNILNKNPPNYKKQIIVPVQAPKIHYVPLKTGLCYDVRMRYHAKIFTSYFEYIDPHPEDPRRIYRIYKILAENGLINDPTLSGVDNIGDLMLKLPIREATMNEILEVHSIEHFKYLEKTSNDNREQLLKETENGDSVYFNNDSFQSAKLSCGGAIEACKAVVEGRVKNAMAVVRPPGHHSEPESAGGFCLFSNVAVATKNILKNYPESVRKVLILDWDIHHGNGTQKAFYNDDNVLYISLHRFELGKYYPGTIQGQYDQTGEGKGEGFNCNITWPIGAVGDAEYMWAFEQVVMPMSREFQPDLVIISSGFDAADGDTIGQCHVSPSCYGHMTHMLKSLARGNLCVVLEGGYNLDAIARSALSVSKILIGEPPDELPDPLKDPKPEVIEMIDKIIRLQSKYWKCFRRRHGNLGCNFKESINDSLISKNFPLQTAIRNFQSKKLFDELNFLTLPIKNFQKNNMSTSTTNSINNKTTSTVISSTSTGTPGNSKEKNDTDDINGNNTTTETNHSSDSIVPPDGSTETKSSSINSKKLENSTTNIKTISPLNENTILCSPAIIRSKTLVVLVHDSPDLWTKRDVSTGVVDLSSTIIIDSTLDFIKWSLDRNYGVIDINIPQTLFEQDNYSSILAAQETLLSFWDNYLKYFPYIEKIVFIGFGDAHAGIVHLLGHRDTRSVVKSVINFLGKKPLKALVPLVDETLSDWYFKNSLVFTDKNHPFWADNENKKPRKKFGRVLRSQQDGIANLIEERFDEATDFILDSFEEWSDEE